jgi:hypothetical protein
MIASEKDLPLWYFKNTTSKFPHGRRIACRYLQSDASVYQSDLSQVFEADDIIT